MSEQLVRVGIQTN